MKFMRQSFKALGYMALSLSVLVVITLVALAAANWTDDPPSDIARQTLQDLVPTDAMLKTNGYLIIVGLTAPVDSGDPVSSAEALGRQYVANIIEARDKARKDPQNFDAIEASATYNEKSEVPIFTFRCPRRSHDGCFSETQTHKDQVHTLLQTHSPLLVRYKAAANAPQFISLPYDFFNPLPSFPQLISVHALLLAKAALQWPLSPSEALDTMEITSKLRARMGKSANSLLEAMVVLEMQSAELRWISQAMERTRASSPTSARIRQLILQPGPDLHSALRGEQQFIAGMLPFMSKKWEHNTWRANRYRDLSGFVSLPIATMNASLENLAQIQAMAHLHANALEAAFNRHNKVLADRYRCDLPIRLRNPVGTCMVAMNAAHYQSYFQRIHDMDGYRRLVMLQYLATAEGVRAQDMQAWLQASPAELRNPYTLQAMQWDAATHSLVFDGKEPQRQNLEGSATYRIALPQAAP